MITIYLPHDVCPTDAELIAEYAEHLEAHDPDYQGDAIAIRRGDVIRVEAKDPKIQASLLVSIHSMLESD